MSVDDNVSHFPFILFYFSEVIQVIKMLILVIVLFLVCWGPRLIFTVVKKSLPGETWVYNIRVASYLLSFIHSAINPFVYGLMSSTFRNIVFKSCAGSTQTEATNGPESCGISGRIIVGKIGGVSGTWAPDELDAAEQEMIAMMGHNSLPRSQSDMVSTSFHEARRSATSDRTSATSLAGDEPSRPQTRMDQRGIPLHI